MEQNVLNFMDFPDCLLLTLLKYLDSTSLYNLSKFNKRLNILIEDRSLWNKIDARNGPHCIEKNEYCLERINNNTKFLCLSGPIHFSDKELKDNDEKNDEILYDIVGNFPKKLTILALENTEICGEKISLRDFPETLVELSFSHSTIKNNSNFFKQTSKQMKNLKVLLLENSPGLDPFIITSISKYENLEIFSLKSSIISFSIAYFGVATFLGFGNLRIFNLKDTKLGDSVLKLALKLPKIRSVFFGKDFNPLTIPCDAEIEANSSNDQEKVDGLDIIDEPDYDVTITDRGTAEFLNFLPKDDEKDEIFSSFLYKEEYGSCKCGYQENINFIKKRKRNYDSTVEEETNGEVSWKRRKTKSTNEETGTRRIEWFNIQPSTSQRERLGGCNVISIQNHSNLDIRGQSVIQISIPTGPPQQPELHLCSQIRVINPLQAGQRKKTGIKQLSFCGFKTVTDLTLKNLNHMELELLDLNGTRTSYNALLNFQKSNPNCRILHPDFCQEV